MLMVLGDKEGIKMIEKRKKESLDDSVRKDIKTEDFATDGFDVFGGTLLLCAPFLIIGAYSFVKQNWAHKTTMERCKLERAAHDAALVIYQPVTNGGAMQE